jgi:hypothetical protein
VYRIKQVVIGPANYAYGWLAFAKVQGTPTFLAESSSVLQRGSHKGKTMGPWFTDPSND